MMRHHWIMKNLDQKFEVVYQNNLDRVYRYINVIVHDGMIAEDITAEVFLKVWKKRHTLLHYENVTGLLYKISRDLAINHLKKVFQDHRKKEEYFYLYFNPEVETDDQILRAVQLAALMEAIDSLPDKCRTVVQMKFIYGRSLKEIASELQISVNTVQNHLTKGKNLIREVISTDKTLVILLISAVPF